MDEIVINGTSYGSPEEMTPEHREIFLQGVKLFSLQAGEELPDTLEIYGNPDGSDLRVEARSTSEEVRVDGELVEGGLAGLPPSMREAARAALAGGGSDPASAPAPSGPDADRPERFDASEIEARLRSSRDDSSLPGSTRTVRLMVGVLVGLVLSLILLALIL